MPPLLSLHNITKSFGATHALHPLELTLKKGDILGLVGENGAGKSTLIKILSGIHRPDSGQFHWEGTPIQFRTPADAIQSGIATIHQELDYCSHLSVAENLFLGEPWPRTWWGGVHWTHLHEHSKKRLAQFDIELDTKRLLHELTAAEKQELAIVSAMAQKARLLILDEPTASLTEPEVEKLFEHLSRLTQSGVTVIYVSHRLDEIFSISNRIAVLRDGTLVADYPTSEVTPEKVIEDMIGKPLDQFYPPRTPHKAGQKQLQLEGVTRKPFFSDISFTLHAGEILGLAGLQGSGRSELARAIYGLFPIESGTMRLNEKSWTPKHPAESLRAGLVYLPEERKRQGIVPDQSVQDSISIGFSEISSHFGMVDRVDEAKRVTESLSSFDIRCNSLSQPMSTLSGGNQQKSLLARWLNRNPKIGILDEPTRGVDVGAKAQIYQLMSQLAQQGKAILLISSDLREITGMCHRVVVMNQGNIRCQLAGDQLNQTNVILASSGLND